MKIKKFSVTPSDINDRVGAKPVICYPNKDLTNNLDILHKARKNLKKIDEVVRYCESDALNTYLIYVQHQLSMGVINEQELNIKKDTLKKFLASQDNPHSEFIQQL